MSVNNSQSHHKSSAQLCHEELVEQLQHFFKFYVSRGSTTRFLRNGEKYYTYFTDNLSMFPTVKNCPNRLTVDKVIVKSSTPRFFLRHSDYLLCTGLVKT